MSDTRREKTLDILQIIQDDCIADTEELEGQPFTGKVVAPEFGKIRAMIAALARILEDHLDRDEP